MKRAADAKWEAIDDYFILQSRKNTRQWRNWITQRWIVTYQLVRELPLVPELTLLLMDLYLTLKLRRRIQMHECWHSTCPLCDSNRRSVVVLWRGMEQLDQLMAMHIEHSDYDVLHVRFVKAVDGNAMRLSCTSLHSQASLIGVMERTEIDGELPLAISTEYFE